MSRSQYSVAIAGGGIIGMSIAWRLAQQHFKVTVFEKGSIGGEASWAGAGMLAPGGEFDEPSPLALMALESRSLYADFVRELERASGLAIDYQECGALDLSYDAADWGLLLARAERQATFGLTSKILKTEQVSTFWPRVRSEGLTGALFYPGDAIVNPRELVLALAAACRQLDVTVLQNTPVNAVRVAETGVQVEGQQFDGVVVAAGAWSSSIHVENAAPVPTVEPVKGHLIGFQQPDQTCNSILRHGHTYLLQRANGLLIAGASVEHVGWDRSIEPAQAASLAQQAAFVLPHLAETTPSETWIGFRPSSTAPQIGPWQSSHLFLAYGHYRNGILLTPVTAQLIVNAISASLRTH